MTEATPLASEQITPETFLAQLRRVNTDRYQAWIGDADDAGILFDAAELGGEVGELLNVVKKLEREARGWRGSRAAAEDFADECADVLICLDKLARRMDVDLEAATIRKFNATSNKVGLPQRLSASPAPSGQEASSAIRGEAAFLCDRLREFERDLLDDEAGRQYHGHVTPSLERLEALLDAPSGQGVSGEVDLRAAAQAVLDSAERPGSRAEYGIGEDGKEVWHDYQEVAQKALDDLAAALAAPAPSCAPGEVAALVQRLFDKRWASSSGEWGVPDWVETDEPRRVGEQILAALSPQGLDAKEGGVTLPTSAMLDAAEREGFDRQQAGEVWIAMSHHTPSQRLDAATVERPSDDDLEPHLPERVRSERRCGIQRSAWITGWFVPWSPRNDNENAEGPWSHWVALAHAIIAADEKARAALVTEPHQHGGKA